MASGKLTKALENVDMVYNDLIVIVNEIIEPYTKEVNDLIDSASASIHEWDNDRLREFMVKLSLKSFYLSEVKDKSSLKAECSEALKKEKYAKSFNGTDGTVAFKENTAIIETTDEILVEAIYTLAYNLFKTKLDEVHRVVDVVKTIIMSRNAENKLTRDTFE